MPATASTQPPEPLAIVGIGCRFPGGIDNPESFWDFLCEGRSAITEVPQNRWDAESYYSKDVAAKGKLITKWGGFVDQLEEFDADFFSITPREAARMDPQQRWLLEITLEAMEDAHCPPGTLRNTRTGVFLGLSDSDYGKIQTESIQEIDGYSNSGNSLSIASNRVSYQYDLKGPALTIDTACSSGMVAVNLACKSLWSGECEHALAGGASAHILPGSSLGFSKANMFSPNGKCHAFDSRADGYVRGEGAGMILIKPLKHALRDGNRIYSVIRASVVNQDGKTSSLTIPSLSSQRSMLKEALEMADISPGQIAYVEAHGTGTPVGDPIEARSIGEVISQGRAEGEDCLIGSVKTNLGHLEPASGLAGIIKASLILKHGSIPPSLNFEKPNPNIPFADLRLRVVTENTPLPNPEKNGAAVVVNSFGFGGTNAQTILQAGPEHDRTVHDDAKNPEKRPLLLAISADNPVGLEATAKSYGEFLSNSDSPVGPVCATAAIKKEHRQYRLVVIGNDRDALVEKLDRFGEEGQDASDDIRTAQLVSKNSIQPVFVYTGQGSQWWAMGRELIEREPTVREVIDEIDGIFRPLAGWSIRDELARPQELSRIDRTDVAQPALFALQAGLTALWRSWGLEPSAVMGHSVGEVAAAYAAGIYDLEQATGLVFHRSRLQQTTGGNGRMAAVGITLDEAKERLTDTSGRVEIAASNSPNLVTFSGDTEALEGVIESIHHDGKFVRWLPIDYAFHSHQMDSIEGGLMDSLGQLKGKNSGIPFISTVEGGKVSGASLDAAYWWRNVRSTVNFSGAIDASVTSGETIFLEIGPHPALRGPILECLASNNVTGRVAFSLKRESDDSQELARNLAELHLAGVSINWQSYFEASPDPEMRLPSYAWQRKPYWLESPSHNRKRTSPTDHPLLGRRTSDPSPAWEFLLDARILPFLEDHKVWDRIVFPATGFAEIGLAVAHSEFAGPEGLVENLEIEKILFLERDAPPTIRVEYDEDEKRFRIFSQQVGSETWNLHATGRLIPRPKALTGSVDLAATRSSLSKHSAHWDFYQELLETGFQFGERFRQIEQVWHDNGQALARVCQPDSIDDELDSYHFHPAVLDACFQAVSGADRSGEPPDGKRPLKLPMSIGRIQMDVSAPPKRFWVVATCISDDGESSINCLDLYDDTGTIFGKITDFKLSIVRNENSSTNFDDCYYRFVWKECGNEETPLPGKSRRVVIFADRGGVALSLKRLLVANDHTVSLVYPGDEFASKPDLEFVVEPTSAEQVGRVLKALAQCEKTEIVAIHLWSLDHPDDASLDENSLMDSQSTGVHSLLALAQTTSEHQDLSRLCCVSRSCLKAPKDPSFELSSAPIPGFLRVASSEIPDKFWMSLMLDSPSQTIAAEIIAGELERTDEESEVAYVDSRRLVRRLERIRFDEIANQTKTVSKDAGRKMRFRIWNERPGTLDHFVANEVPTSSLDPDMVEIEVKAAGINFRDLMKALGTYPGTSSELGEYGDEFSGVVTRAGSGISEYKPGDEVVGFDTNCFQSYISTRTHSIYPKPKNLSFIEAAAIPTVFLTAFYAIEHLARLKSGDSILIHAAAGGVGLAAIQIAKSRHLKIFATAGSDEKRRILLEQGVDHIMDSRTLAFADEIMEITGGNGVDAILNSLSGEFLIKSISVLAPFGKFLEIGKVDIFSDRRIGMRALRNNISFHTIDLDQFVRHWPGDAANMVREIVEAFDSGQFQPLPCEVFPATKIGQAFRKMARGEHYGKLVLNFDFKSISVGKVFEKGELFTSDFTYLVSGGASGFGFEVAKWLIQNGAKHIALLSRSGPKTAEIEDEIEVLRSNRISIRDERVDIRDGGALQKSILAIETEMPPVGGVIHAAMILDNLSIPDLDKRSFDAAFAPKAYGAWNLHASTLHRELDFFICFSSLAAVIGAFKQANYNAGNTFLDELCHYRRRCGLRAMSVNWGALAGAGYVARNQNTRDYLEAIGVKAFHGAEVFSILEQLFTKDVPQIVAAKVDWGSLIHLAPAIGSLPIYNRVVQDSGRGFSAGSLKPLILAAPSSHQLTMIEDFIAGQIADVFGSDASSIDHSVPVTDIGLDSLMAIELLNRIESGLGIQFPIGSILNGPAISELAVLTLEALIASAGAFEKTEGAKKPSTLSSQETERQRVDLEPDAENRN